ncbi:hypothetical protein V5F77_20530 [Xanthobacter sp. DSM 24535]|uniref:hypothetical protein n=1 Tax=Roseixanthobacter psychrophilus TaxID=3119917 RepID=UPI00372AB476
MAITFRPGDEVVQPFLLVVDDTIVNISDGTVSAQVVARGINIDLTVGAGIVIEQPAPAPASDGAGQVAHGLVVLDEALTGTLPIGNLTRLHIYYVNSAGVRMSAECIDLIGVSC